MNATQLTNVLQKVKADPVLQETLRVTKQDWVELNLTTQESLQVPMNIASAPEFSDGEIEYMYANKWTTFIFGLWTNLKQKMDERAIRGEKISDMRNRSTDDLGVRK